MLSILKFQAALHQMSRIVEFLGVCLLCLTLADICRADGLFPALGPEFDLESSESRRGDFNRQLDSISPGRGPGIEDFPALGGFPVRPERLTVPPAPSGEIDAERERILRLNARYQNPMMVRFIRGLSPGRAMQLYAEVSQLIDSRHQRPVTYAERTLYGLGNIERAMSSSSFLAAAGISSHRVGRQVEADFAMMRTSAGSVRDFQGAITLMQNAMNSLNRSVGLPASFAAIEFVFGAAESLDRYSAFEPDKNAGGPSANLDDHVVGIGVEIEALEEGAVVLRVLRNSPAASAGLQAEDVLTAIDGRSIAKLNIAQIADRIAGQQGTTVRLQVKRGRQIYQVSLVRSRVTIESVSDARLIDAESGVGYIRLQKFSSTSEQEFDSALWKLHREGMQSLIVDLRGNPGGLLTTAISLSDKFLPCGTIVSTRGRLQADNSVAAARRSQTWKVPLVVLIDNDSASASEIFAAAIQENRRGIVVGRRSYGKGSVQTHFPLKTVSGTLRLTTASFYSPNGRMMAGQGVVPDVRVSEVSIDSLASQDRVDLARGVEVASSREARSLAAAASRCRQPQPDWLLGQVEN